MKKTLSLIFIFSLIAASSLAQADFTITQGIERIELTVDGLACPFCTKGLGMRLEKVEHVTSISIHLQKGVAEIGFDKKSLPDFRALWHAVGEAGFTPSKLSIEAVGKLAGEKGTLHLSVSFNGQNLTIPLRNESSLLKNVNTSKFVKIAAYTNFDEGPRFNLGIADSVIMPTSH